LQNNLFGDELSIFAEKNNMKLRWWVIGIAAVAAGSMFMMKHLVDNKKTFLKFVDKNNEKSFGRFAHETEFDDAEYLA
jgi:hypothetical protein